VSGARRRLCHRCGEYRNLGGPHACPPHVVDFKSAARPFFERYDAFVNDDGLLSPAGDALIQVARYWSREDAR